VNAITEMILVGQLPAGAPVREAELAEQLGVSRTPVREAIAQLVSRGLLTKEGGRSARVHQPSLEDLIEIYELRTLTESYLASRAAEMATPEIIDKLTVLEEKLRTTTGDEWFEHHIAFHSTIAKAARRARFIDLADKLRDQSEPYVRLVTKLDTALQQRAAQEHAGLLKAIREGDAITAGELTTAHLQSTVESVERIFRAAQGLLVPMSAQASKPGGGENDSTSPRT